MLTFKSYSYHRKPQYSAAVGLIVTFFWHYLIVKAFGRKWKVSHGLYYHSGIKDKKLYFIV